MATWTIPLTNAAALGAFNLTVDLDGVDYQLRFQYNSREGFWYFDLLDSAQNVLRSGIKVVSNFPMLIRYRDLEARPAGELISFDTRLEPLDPGLEDLDLSSVFGYADADDLAEVGYN
jgi:hypothetical protein